MRFAPASQCDVPWCRSWHGPDDAPDHAAQLALWRIRGAEVELFIGQAPGCAPVVRLARSNGSGQQRTRDLAPELAADLAEILDVLPGRQRELIAGLRAAAEALGE
jgi:hypothetical protein